MCASDGLTQSAEGGGGGTGQPASEKEAESWTAADKFTVVLETAGLNTTELGGYCRERGLYPEKVDRWRKASQDANAKTLLTMSDQQDLQKRHQICDA